MRRKEVSAATLAGLAIVCGCGLFLAGCFPSKGASDIPLPVITISPATTSVPAGGSVQFNAKVVSQFNTTISWSVNNILGGNAALGTVNSSGFYTAPAAVPSPATVTVRATSSTEGSTYGSALVTITAPPGNVSVGISPSAATVAPGLALQFTAGVSGTTNPAVQWSVNGVVGGSPTSGTINSSGFYLAPPTIPSPATVTVTASSIAQPSAISSAAVVITAPSISPGSASIWAGSTVQFSATGAGSTTIEWKVNNTSGGSATSGTICNASSTTCGTVVTYTAPPTSPGAPITITAVSVPSGTLLGTATVTIVPPTVAGIEPANSATQVGTTSQFTASLIPANSVDVEWWVNGIQGGSSTVGTISTSGVYTAPAAVPSPPTVVVTVTGEANKTDSASTTFTVNASNTAPLYVNLGLNGDTGSPSSTVYNGLSTTVTVCLPGTIQCQTVPDVLVDTGSVGLRVLNSALVTAPGSELTAETDSQGYQIQECVQFANTSYAWGPVLVADVHLGGEVASSVPIQVLGSITGAPSYPVPYADCLSLGSGPDLNTVEALGANGILGIGTQMQDCGLNCSGGASFPGYPYYICPGNACQPEAVAVGQQVSNLVAFFPVDNNGVELSLPAISAAGAISLPYVGSDGSGFITAGQMIFGVGTESNNALGNATIYAVDDNGNFPKIVFDGSTYTSAGVLDSGSKALYLGNATTLGTTECTDAPFYCPGSPLSLSLTPYGENGSSGTVNLTIQSADSLFAGCPGCAAFDDLGGPTGDGLAPDFLDIGLPFFFGRNVFVGIAGTTVPNKVSAPNGYFAF